MRMEFHLKKIGQEIYCQRPSDALLAQYVFQPKFDYPPPWRIFEIYLMEWSYFFQLILWPRFPTFQYLKITVLHQEATHRAHLLAEHPLELRRPRPQLHRG